MAFISYAVAELSDPLKIEDSVIAYAELQLGMQRNQRYMQNVERVKPRPADLTRELLLR